MNPLLKKVKNIYTEGCVSIIFNTHRTKPDNQKDPLNLKNLIKEAENRLIKEHDKKFAGKIIERINKLADEINHNFNLESLVIFVNADFAEFTRLPIKVTNRAIVDNTFATRDLVRAMHQEAGYYMLVLSRQKARLIEAHNDKVVKEFQDDFPIDSKLYATDKVKLSTAKGQDNLTEEFFNQVDKQVVATVKDNPMPIILATETRNFEHYKKIADRKELIAGHINRNRDDEAPHHIVPDAWKVMQSIIKEKQSARINELEIAVSQGKFLSDMSEIWKALNEGRGQTLFVKRGYFQPAIVEKNNVKIVDKIELGQKSIVDDIVDEMIEVNLSYGGDTVFLKGDELKEFQNLALIVRY